MNKLVGKMSRIKTMKCRHAWVTWSLLKRLKRVAFRRRLKIISMNTYRTEHMKFLW